MKSSEVTCQVGDGTLFCGFMPTSLDSRAHSKLRFEVKKHSTEGDPLVLSSKHPRNSHIKVEGTLFSQAGSKYAIGVFREGSDTMDVYDASSFSVQTLVGDTVCLINDAVSAENVVSQSYNEKKSELINTYAPVKRQRQLRATVNAVVSDEKIEGFEDSVTQMKTETRVVNESGILVQMRNLLPPFDLTAETPDKVFSDVFPLLLLDAADVESSCHAILQWVHDPANRDANFASIWTLGCVSQLGRLFASSRHQKRKTFAKQLNVIISMIMLYNCRRKKNWTAWDIYASEQLGVKLAELFTNGVIGATIDRENTSKLLAHICVHLLRATPAYEFDFADLKADLNIQAKEMNGMMGYCGMTTKGPSLLGKLKAPLVVPTSFGPKGKGKGKK